MGEMRLARTAGKILVGAAKEGRITHIDNIGLVKPGLEHTTGFGTHK